MKKTIKAYGVFNTILECPCIFADFIGNNGSYIERGSAIFAHDDFPNKAKMKAKEYYATFSKREKILYNVKILPCTISYVVSNKKKR
jgi:hypothetical protein